MPSEDQKRWRRGLKSYILRLECPIKNWHLLYQYELEIWGRAQRDAARRHKSDGWLIQGGEIYLVAKSRGPKSNAVAYAARALST